MARKTREQLKEVFVNGATPEEKDFADVFDSFNHQDDSSSGVEFATHIEAENGNDNTKIMTSLRVKQAITAIARLANLMDLSNEVNARIQTAINNLINSAPGTLDTLGEIATALEGNDNEIAALMTAINNRYTKAELDAFFEGVSGGKKQIDWERVTGKPATFPAPPHTHRISDLAGVDGKNSQHNLDSRTSLATSQAVYAGREFARKWDNLKGKPATFPSSPHTHPVNDLDGVDGKSDSLVLNRSDTLATSKALFDAINFARNWGSLSNKPATFPSSPHTHPLSDLNGVVSKSSRHDLDARDRLANSKAVYDGREFAREWDNLTSIPTGLPRGIRTVSSVRISIGSGVSSRRYRTYYLQYLSYTGVWINILSGHRIISDYTN